MITLEQLKAVYKEAPESRLKEFLDPLNETLQRFEINTPVRIQMFLAQIGHESGELRYVLELASGQSYEGRKDLGNTQIGDGVKYKGRGLLQITGRNNYVLCGMCLDLPLLENPELLEQHPYSSLSSGWFWSTNNLNSFCDANDFERLTKKINGGLNGYANRLLLYQRAKKVIQ